MISRFSVRNFKSLVDVDLELTPFHALIGPNDSGKSSILQAIAALSHSVDRSLPECFPGPWTGRQLVWHGDPARKVEFRAQIPDGAADIDYTLGLNFAPETRVVTIADERLMVANSLFEGPRFLGNQNSSVWFALNHPRDADESRRKVLVSVHDSLSGAQLCHWNPSFLAAPAAPDSSRRFKLHPSGFGLALTLDDILGFDRMRFTEIEEQFTRIFPEIRSVKLIPEAAFKAPADLNRPVPLLQSAEGKGLYFEFGGNSELVPASQVSDGALIVLAFLTVANVPKTPRFILVEEPENGIHPKRLAQVLSILRELSTAAHGPQVIMTTHSPYVLDLMKPEEVTLCRRAPDGSVTTTKLADSAAVRRQIDIFGLGEIWTSEGDESLAQSATGSGVKKHETIAPETEPAT